MRLILPYPPSINHYWRHVGPRVLISREGREYRRAVVRAIGMFIAVSGEKPMIAGRVVVDILAILPDRRRRDLDNLAKPLLDALAHAKVYEDDSQIDWLSIRRGEVVKPGHVVVDVQEVFNMLHLDRSAGAVT